MSDPAQEAPPSGEESQLAGRIRREAKVAGLHSLEIPSLEDVERRRLELWLVASALILGLGAATALGSLEAHHLPTWLTPTGLSIGAVALSLVFCGYGLEKALHLRRLSRLLVNERLLSTALSSRLREISWLLEAGRAVNSTLELDQVLDSILRGASELLPARTGSVMLLEDGCLRVVAAVGPGSDVGSVLALGDGIAGQVALRREPLLVDGENAGRRLLSRGERSGGARSAICVPLMHQQELLGVLQVSAADEHRFTEYDLRAVSLFGENAATAILKARLLEVSQRHAAELAELALHDPLTRLPNRMQLTERLQSILAAGQRNGTRSAVLLVDLDGFKQVNDRFGHDIGDKLLTAVSRRLVGCLRPRDLAARLGGDEFAVLLEGVGSPEMAMTVADRIVTDLSSPYVIGDLEPLSVTASVGVTMATDTDEHEDVLRRADQALYAAKAAGKSRSRLFDPSGAMEHSARRQALTELTAALDGNQFRVLYQPVVRAADGSPTGIAAQLHWEHPERGLLAADEFLDGAVESGAICEIGSWLVAEACRELRNLRDSMHDAAPGYVSVELSIRQLQRPDFVTDTRAALTAAGLPGESLVLEVSEGALTGDDPTVRAAVDRLRGAGVRVALDDFGTGRSSLLSLLELPIDLLNLSTTLVEGIDHRPANRAVATAVVGLAHDLGVATVAKGVDELAQLDVVRELGCGDVQGRQYAGPTPGPQLPHVLLDLVRRAGHGDAAGRGTAGVVTRLPLSRVAGERS